uniref:Uncharacterized protein n=1 Tax=Daphnia galeata TaxID=27404 RepID=A0A8J2RC93_9CRUS|nr:unnamed protein product [Daphnia galeata]
MTSQMLNNKWIVLGLGLVFLIAAHQAKPVSRPSPGFSYFSRSNKLLYNHEMVPTTAKPLFYGNIPVADGRNSKSIAGRPFVANKAQPNKKGPYGMTFFKSKPKSSANNNSTVISPPVAKAPATDNINDRKNNHSNKGSHHHSIDHLEIRANNQNK